MPGFWGLAMTKKTSLMDFCGITCDERNYTNTLMTLKETKSKMTQLDSPSTPETNSVEEIEWPIFGEEEEKLLLEVFRSGQWWYGDKVQEFEKKFAELHGAKHGITCSNGTIALDVALRSVGVGPGDEVIVPDYTFIATAGAVVGIGAIPRFADVEMLTANIDFESAEALVNEHTRAIIVVHFGGLPVDMDKAREFAARHNLALIEDAAHSWGSQWKGKGTGAIGDLGTFSFQYTKNITSGEGGIVLTDDDELAATVRSYTNCGRMVGHEWYEHFLVGGNHRITEFQAALLLGQLTRVMDHLEKREANAVFLDAELAQIDGISLNMRDERVTRRAHHIYMFNYDKDRFGGLTKPEFIEKLNQKDIPASPGYLWPVHKNRCFRTMNENPRPENAWMAKLCNERGINFNEINNPNAETIARETMIWLPHTLLLGSQAEMQYVVKSIKEIQQGK